MSYAGEASTPNTIKGSETYKNARKNQKTVGLIQQFF